VLKKTFLVIAVLALAVLFMAEDGCDVQRSATNSGVKQVVASDIPRQASGYTIEQENIYNRLKEDNKPGAIKHLYIISPYSGQVILYSTVKGKVTSGGKRLTPETINPTGDSTTHMNWVSVNGGSYTTDEVLQDDGTYGHSGDYLYWWDVRGIYHQHYLTGGQIVHVSSQPLPIKSVTINLEAVSEK
jgi:hypothetical protein